MISSMPSGWTSTATVPGFTLETGISTLVSPALLGTSMFTTDAVLEFRVASTSTGAFTGSPFFLASSIALGLRRGLAMLVGLHRAGGAIGGLVLGDGAAVGIGCGLGSAAVLGGSGLPLGTVGLGGGLHLSSAAGIVTVRGRTTAEAAEAARGRTAGGLGLNGQRVNGVQSFLWRKGNRAEAGVVDRPPRCSLPVVE